MIEPLVLILGIVVIAVILLVLKLALSVKNKDRADMSAQLTIFEKNQEKLERSLKEEIAGNRAEAAAGAMKLRQEITNLQNKFGDSIFSRMSEIANLQKNQLDTFSNQLSALTRSNETKLDKMRETIEDKLKYLQEDNTKKLEQMRVTVDEKLHATLERRLGESFKIVSDRLEMVHKGLGEMQSLASNVGDLKKVLTNVKTRGTWGEIQLGNLLEQILTKDQYAENVAVKKDSRERVEYALRLPGRDEIKKEIWLPIDAKFPQEDYLKLIDASEQGDPALIENISKQLEARIKSSAREIKTKYIEPPQTTDFAIMYLPIEGLYAEVLRRPGLCENIQQEFRVIMAGPTTLTAILNSLQMGFKTLAIEKHSSEVWRLLSTVKTEFGKFGDILEKTHKKIQEAGNTLEIATRKTRTIERKLNGIQEIPSPEEKKLVDNTTEIENKL